MIRSGEESELLEVKMEIKLQVISGCDLIGTLHSFKERASMHDRILSNSPYNLQEI